MISIFDFDHYKEYVAAHLASRPRGGRGEFRKMAKFLRVHSTFVSQVFRGQKELSFEQAAVLCEYLALNDDESEFFVGLVELARSGTPRLTRMIRAKLGRARDQAKDFSRRLPRDRQLTDAERGIFHSNWYYSGIRLASSLPQMNTIESIADSLRLPRQHVAKVMAFLLEQNLVVQTPSGFHVGSQRTFIEPESPLVKSHHRNWRLKALACHEQLSRDELAFTAPLTIARSDFAKIRTEIQMLIERVSNVVTGTNPDTLACLNIDWVIVTDVSGAPSAGARSS